MRRTAGFDRNGRLAMPWKSLFAVAQISVAKPSLPSSVIEGSKRVHERGNFLDATQIYYRHPWPAHQPLRLDKRATVAIEIPDVAEKRQELDVQPFAASGRKIEPGAIQRAPQGNTSQADQTRRVQPDNKIRPRKPQIKGLAMEVSLAYPAGS